MMYSRAKTEEGELKISIRIWLNTGGSVDGLSNVYTAATGVSGSRFLNVGCSWVCWNADTRNNDDKGRGTGIDEGRQSKEEYGSGKGLGMHLKNQEGMVG